MREGGGRRGSIKQKGTDFQPFNCDPNPDISSEDRLISLYKAAH